MPQQRGETWEPFPGVTVWETHDGTGWGWNVVGLRGGNGALTLYSPSWLGPDTFERIERVGKVEALLAPSYFHHVTLERFRQRWPAAQAVAPKAALPRLIAKHHPGLTALENSLEVLPKDARWHPCEGLKTGEGWVVVGPPGACVLVVCDAFLNRTRAAEGWRGWALEKAVGIKQGVMLSPTLKWLHARDMGQFKAWARRVIEVERPTVLVPTHGAPMVGPDTTARLLQCLG